MRPLSHILDAVWAFSGPATIECQEAARLVHEAHGAGRRLAMLEAVNMLREAGHVEAGDWLEERRQEMLRAGGKP